MEVKQAKNLLLSHIKEEYLGHGHTSFDYTWDDDAQSTLDSLKLTDEQLDTLKAEIEKSMTSIHYHYWHEPTNCNESIDLSALRWIENEIMSKLDK